MRGSAPGRAQPADLRPGSFKQGHEKRGGRKLGTPNLFSADYRKAILEAAWRIGYDGSGKNGVVGYFKWVAIRHPAVFGTTLISLLPFENAGSNIPEKLGRTAEETDQLLRKYIGLAEKPREAANRSGWVSGSMGLDRPGLSCWRSDATRRRETESFLRAGGRRVSVAAHQTPPIRRSERVCGAKAGRSVSKLIAPTMQLHIGDQLETLKKAPTATRSRKSMSLRTTLAPRRCRPRTRDRRRARACVARGQSP
jgi:hypothetical protein